MYRLVVTLFLLVSLNVQESLSLKNVELRMPLAVRAGTALRLTCHYDLDGAELYSVKFYQGDQEFYRFVPKETPPTKVFPLPEVQIDIFESNNTVVTLSNVQKELTGQFTCEVSADAPFFHTVIKSAHLVVVEEPRKPPEINVEKTKYALGEKIKANCSSRHSFPAANLTFFVNNEKLRNSDLISLSWFVKSEPAGLESSLLQLHTLAVPQLFREGRLQLACLATQYSLYKQITYVTLVEDTPQLAHVLGATPPLDHRVNLVEKNRAHSLNLNNILHIYTVSVTVTLFELINYTLR